MATFVSPGEENSTSLLNTRASTVAVAKQLDGVLLDGADTKPTASVILIGSRISAKVRSWKKAYDGTVIVANTDGTFGIKFDDGEIVPNCRAMEIQHVYCNNDIGNGISATQPVKSGTLTTYEVSFDDENSKKTTAGGKNLSLQDRFKAMRRRKLAESKHAYYIRGRGNRSEQRKMMLRKQFISQVKKYIGTPYARKYHEKGTELYDAPIFLDCCALIRRAVNDLAEGFGFLLGRWNQNYQMSTLPDPTEFKDLKPGDLIFYEGTYYPRENKKPPKQSLNLVHVEMFVGGKTGRGTIGSRWQKVGVEEHDDYEFESKTYHSVKHHFRSIDRWLNGECKPTHEFWPINSVTNMAMNKYSMFNAENATHEETADGESIKVEGGSKMLSVKKRFYCGEGNGWRMIADALLERGDWIQIPFDQGFSQNYQLKWVERRSQIDFANLQCSNQVANHISNNEVITTKKGLMTVLNHLDEEEFIDVSFAPQTFNLSLASERLKFLKSVNPKMPHSAVEPWIMKPVAMNQGRGIKIYKNPKKVYNQILGDHDAQDEDGLIDQWCGSHAFHGFIMQKYITNPLLLEGRKFDIRCYCLISECHEEQLKAFYSPGYLRLALEKYSNSDFENQFIHLNNVAIQRGHKDYKAKRDESIWSVERLDSYMKENYAGQSKWSVQKFHSEIKRIMSLVVYGASKSLERKKGTFDLLGFDFMVDSELQIKLIEVNTNPALHKNDGAWLKTLFPKLVRETLDIVLEANNLGRADELIQTTGVESSSGADDKLFSLIYDEKRQYAFYEDGLLH